MATGTVTTPRVPYKTYPASASLPINFTATTTDLALFTNAVTLGANEAAGYLLGWVISESTGSASASFAIYDGTATTYQGSYHAGVVSLAQGTTSSVWFGVNAVRCTTGSLYLHVLSGSVVGSVFYTN